MAKGRNPFRKDKHANLAANLMLGASLCIAGWAGCAYFAHSEEKEDHKPAQKTIEQMLRTTNNKLSQYPAKDINLFAKLLYGEARGQSDELKRDIAYSVINRTGKQKWWGNTLDEVIKKPYQYSCFNENDPNRKEVENPRGKAWEDCLRIAKEVLSNPYNDTTKGATHYYTNWIKTPNWAAGIDPVKEVPSGKYTTRFYKLER